MSTSTVPPGTTGAESKSGKGRKKPSWHGPAEGPFPPTQLESVEFVFVYNDLDEEWSFMKTSNLDHVPHYVVPDRPMTTEERTRQEYVTHLKKGRAMKLAFFAKVESKANREIVNAHGVKVQKYFKYYQEKVRSIYSFDAYRWCVENFRDTIYENFTYPFGRWRTPKLIQGDVPSVLDLSLTPSERFASGTEDVSDDSTTYDGECGQE